MKLFPNISTDHILIYFFNYKQAFEGLDIYIDQYKDLLSCDELEALNNSVVPNKRTEQFFSKIILRLILSKRQGVAPLDLNILRGANGKPYLPGNPVYFNLSHSNGILCIAVCKNRPIGVDIEKIYIREKNVIHRMANKIFSAKELEILRDKDNLSSQTNYFIKKFTIKEAFSKMFGKGFCMNFREIDTASDGFWQQNNSGYFSSRYLEEYCFSIVYKNNTMKTIPENYFLDITMNDFYHLAEETISAM
jgi:phosphopantetheinyl transferase